MGGIYWQILQPTITFYGPLASAKATKLYMGDSGLMLSWHQFAQRQYNSDLDVHNLFAWTQGCLHVCICLYAIGIHFWCSIDWVDQTPGVLIAFLQRGQLISAEGSLVEGAVNLQDPPGGFIFPEVLLHISGFPQHHDHMELSGQTSLSPPPQTLSCGPQTPR